jgi:acetyl-CoA acetyltransferase
MEAGFDIARRLEESSGLSLREIDVPQLYDGFSPFIYFWLESLGFCPVGEAHRFVQDGGIRTDGGLPVLSGGGALGNGRMHGVPQMLECYLQLSGRAAGRQLASARVGLACHSSPHYGGAVLYTAEPP